jgi:hypothetical protein
MNALAENGFFEPSADGIGEGKTLVLPEAALTSLVEAQTRNRVTRVPCPTTGNMAPLWAAMAKAQAMFEPIIALHKAEIQKKAGGSYFFWYADLEEILAKTRNGLTSNGLSLMQIVTGGPDSGTILTTILAHESGASLECEITLPSSVDIKEFGGYITYVRRYIAAPLLGVASTESVDHDGSAPGDGTGEPSPSQAEDVHPELAKCTSLQELTSVMSKIQPAAERRKWVPYYNQRQRDLQALKKGEA